MSTHHDSEETDPVKLVAIPPTSSSTRWTLFAGVGIAAVAAAAGAVAALFLISSLKSRLASTTSILREAESINKSISAECATLREELLSLRREESLMSRELMSYQTRYAFAKDAPLRFFFMSMRGMDPPTFADEGL